MASVESTGWARGSGESAHDQRKQDRALAPLGVVTALSSALTIAAVLVVAAVLHELLSVTELPAPTALRSRRSWRCSAPRSASA